MLYCFCVNQHHCIHFPTVIPFLHKLRDGKKKCSKESNPGTNLFKECSTKFCTFVKSYSSSDVLDYGIISYSRSRLGWDYFGHKFGLLAY